MNQTQEQSGAQILIKIVIGIAVFYAAMFFVARWMNRDQYKAIRYPKGMQDMSPEDLQAISEDDDEFYRQQDGASEPRGRFGY